MSRGRFEKLELDESGTGINGLTTGGSSDRLEKSLQAGERNAKYFEHKADSSLFAGDLEKALRNYSKSLTDDPLYLNAWLGQIMMLLQLEEYNEASIWSDKAFENFPQNPQILSLQAVAKGYMGSRKEARSLSDRAIQSKGEYDIIWMSRGELMLMDGRPASKECFNKAIKISERKDLISLLIGERYFRNEHYHDALLVLRKVIQQRPESAWAWFLFACSQRELNMDEESTVSFKQAIKLSPDNPGFRKTAMSSKKKFSGYIRDILKKIVK